MASAARLSGHDLAALGLRGPQALSGVWRDGFRLWLAGRGFAESTQVTYYKRAREYLKWLVVTDSHPEALSDGPAREDAVTEFLCTRQPAARKVTLAAIRVLYEYFGLGPVMVDPEPVDQVVPPRLTEEEQSRVLDAAAARTPRDYALITLMLDVGPRSSELRRLDLGAVDLSARAGSARLTAPDGQVRTVALTQATTWVQMGYRRERQALLGHKSRERAYFVTLSSHSRFRDDESLGYVVAAIGDDAGLSWKLTPSAVRATVETRLYRSGMDPSEVRARMGQAFVNGPRVRALLGADSPQRIVGGVPLSSAQLSFDLTYEG